MVQDIHPALIRRGATEAILLEVMKVYDITREELMSHLRGVREVEARFAAIRLMKELLCMPAREIGWVFNRDHSTILHALRVHQDRMDTIPDEAARFERLRAGLLPRPTLQEAPYPSTIPTGEGIGSELTR